MNHRRLLIFKKLELRNVVCRKFQPKSKIMDEES